MGFESSFGIGLGLQASPRDYSNIYAQGQREQFARRAAKEKQDDEKFLQVKHSQRKPLDHLRETKKLTAVGRHQKPTRQRIVNCRSVDSPRRITLEG